MTGGEEKFIDGVWVEKPEINTPLEIPRSR